MLKSFISLTDEQWLVIQKLMDWDPPAERGKPRANLRKVWNSIFYILTKGCRWADLPNDRDIYAARATAHQWMLQWQNRGVFDRVVVCYSSLLSRKKLI